MEVPVQVIETELAPDAIGPYSQAVSVEGWIYCSGQIPIDPANAALQLFEGDVGRQTKLVLANLEAVLKAAGATLQDVVKTTVYLHNLKAFDQMNQVYAEVFGTHRPARSCVEVSRLPRGVEVEIEAVAYRRKRDQC